MCRLRRSSVQEIDDQRPDHDAVDGADRGAGRDGEHDRADAEHEQRGRHDVEARADHAAEAEVDALRLRAEPRGEPGEQPGRRRSRLR